MPACNAWRHMAACTAGDRALYDEAMPMLEVMGKRSFFLGEVGQGAKMKLVINMVRGHRISTANRPRKLMGGRKPSVVTQSTHC